MLGRSKEVGEDAEVWSPERWPSDCKSESEKDEESQKKGC
jgi:hypothetical protein